MEKKGIRDPQSAPHYLSGSGSGSGFVSKNKICPQLILCRKYVMYL
jgi:hypothetical protein